MVLTTAIVTVPLCIRLVVSGLMLGHIGGSFDAYVVEEQDNGEITVAPYSSTSGD